MRCEVHNAFQIKFAGEWGDVDGKAKAYQVVPVEGPEPCQTVETHEFGVWNPWVWYEAKDALTRLAVTCDFNHGCEGTITVRAMVGILGIELPRLLIIERSGMMVGNICNHPKETSRVGRVQRQVLCRKI